MRQGDKIDFGTVDIPLEFLADDIDQFIHLEILRYGQLADGDDQLRLQQLYLTVDPLRTGRYLAPVRYTVAAFRVLTGKTSAHSRHIDLSPEIRLADTDGLKPFE